MATVDLLSKVKNLILEHSQDDELISSFISLLLFLMLKVIAFRS